MCTFTTRVRIFVHGSLQIIFQVSITHVEQYIYPKIVQKNYVLQVTPKWGTIRAQMRHKTGNRGEIKTKKVNPS